MAIIISNISKSTDSGFTTTPKGRSSNPLQSDVVDQQFNGLMFTQGCVHFCMVYLLLTVVLLKAVVSDAPSMEPSELRTLGLVLILQLIVAASLYEHKFWMQSVHGMRRYGWAMWCSGLMLLIVMVASGLAMWSGGAAVKLLMVIVYFYEYMFIAFNVLQATFLFSQQRIDALTHCTISE